MRYKLFLILIMLIIALACLLLWLLTTGELSNFGLNAFTETLGILITVLIVDHLIKRQEELRSLPQKATSYEDVRLFTSRIVSFWSEVYRACVPEASPSSIHSLFCEASFDKMRMHLNLDANASVTPSRSWWVYVPQILSEQKELAETILERHNNVLDPKAYSFVHQIASELMAPNLMHTLRQSDTECGFPRPRILGSYFFVIGDYFASVIGLVDWCEAQFKQLEQNGIKGLKRVCSTIGPWEAQSQPASMIGMEALKEQFAAVQQFRQAHDAKNSAQN